MCQRVIHPVLQHYLRRHGLLVVERLGIALIQPIVQMTGKCNILQLSVMLYPAQIYQYFVVGRLVLRIKYIQGPTFYFVIIHGFLYININPTRFEKALVFISPTVPGAQAVALYQTPIPPEAYGQVKGCFVRTVGSRKMLHLLPPREPVPAVCTMVLCHRNDTMLNELKVDQTEPIVFYV